MELNEIIYTIAGILVGILSILLVISFFVSKRSSKIRAEYFDENSFASGKEEVVLIRKHDSFPNEKKPKVKVQRMKRVS